MKRRQIDEDSFFIHFETPQLCQQFKQYYTGPIGHTCCSGKGCKLLDVTSWNQIHNIKKIFLSNH